jgi:uncharacterized protein (DUF1697 family)
MKMADVCTVFERVGMSSITAVLASGNILFSSSESMERSKQILEGALSTSFSYEAYLFVRDKSQIETIVRQNPYKSNAEFHVYVFVGVANIEDALWAEFERSKKSDGEAGTVVAGNFYWQVPKGSTLDSEFGKVLGRKTLKNAFTSRNINTVEKILKKMSSCSPSS